MGSFNPVSGSGGGIGLGHSPRGVGIDKYGRNSSILLLVVILGNVLLFVHSLVIRSLRLGQILLDLVQLSFFWPHVTDGSTSDERVCRRVNVLIQEDHSPSRQIDHVVITDKEDVDFFLSSSSLD